jgi:hypothetical protein
LRSEERVSGAIAPSATWTVVTTGQLSGQIACNRWGRSYPQRRTTVTKNVNTATTATIAKTCVIPAAPFHPDPYG